MKQAAKIAMHRETRGAKDASVGYASNLQGPTIVQKKQALIDSTFGSRVAEDEAESLRLYFVETEQWRRTLSGDVDVVFGAKGAGKSALYSLLVAQQEKLRLGRRTVFIAAENPRGTPAFRDLAADPPATELEFRGLWKLYFLTLLGNYCRRQLEASKSRNASASIVIDALTKNGLLAPNVNLISRLKAVLDYMRKRLPRFEGGITDPNTGIEYTGKIILAEPTAEQAAEGFLSADGLIDTANKALNEQDITVWLVLDRLDVAFADSTELEGNALRSLFRVYLDMISLSNVDIKIFLRDDIWRKVLVGGFREASHVTRTLTIGWERQAFLNLIVRRILHNESICNLYGVDKAAILESADLQRQFFDRVFPAQVDIGKRQPDTLDWMLSRTADGSKRTAPRELIHLLSSIRDEQLRSYEFGNGDPPGENLFDSAAIRAGLPAVSKARFEQTLCAEYPGLKSWMEKLEREKTQQSAESLSKIWRCTTEKASEIAEHLVEVGFFERRGPKESPAYWVPFLYRDALRMVQGQA